MNFFKNLSIRTKYIVPLIITTLGFLGVIAYGVNTINSNSNTFVNFIDRDQALLLSLNNMYAQGLQSEQATRNILLNPTDQKAKDNYAQANTEFIAELAVADNAAIGRPELLARLGTLDGQWVALDNLKKQVQELAISGNAKEGVTLLTTTETGRWRKLRATLLGLIADAGKSSLTNKVAVQKATSDAFVNVAVWSIIVVLFGIVVILLASKGFVRPIRILEESADKVASGNTDVVVDIDSRDELGKLAQSFNGMVVNIKNAMREVREKSEAAESAARESQEAKALAEKQSGYLSSSVESILSGMDKFANGDLTVKMDITSDDEIGKLFDGFNRAVGNIRAMIQELQESVEMTATAATQISSSSEELAAGAQEQSAQSSEVAAAVEEMTRTIIDNAANATKTAHVATENGRLATSGGEIVQETTSKMREIAGVVTNSAATVEKLGASSQQISEITSVIDDIADQTNLLALNAAIEAARAGEQGRGFAVVADEVRKLAERTTKATKEIEDMIKGIQAETKLAVESMKRGTKEVEEGLASADKAGEALEQIVSETQKSVDMINQIAAASEEQSATSEQISKNVEAISSVSNQSAAGVSQIAQSADELNRQTENLRNLVARFKVESARESHHFSRTVTAGQNGHGHNGNGHSGNNRKHG